MVYEAKAGKIIFTLDTNPCHVARRLSTIFVVYCFLIVWPYQTGGGGNVCLFVSIFESGVNVGMISYDSQKILYRYGTVAYPKHSRAHSAGSRSDQAIWARE